MVFNPSAELRFEQVQYLFIFDSKIVLEFFNKLPNRNMLVVLLDIKLGFPNIALFERFFLNFAESVPAVEIRSEKIVCVFFITDPVGKTNLV